MAYDDSQTPWWPTGYPMIKPAEPRRRARRKTLAKTEVEHKFLVNHRLLPALRNPTKITQGYLSRAPVVRVRLCSRGGREWGLVTVKGKGKRSRREFEWRVPAEEVKEMLGLCQHGVIKKVRYRIGRWEVDEFKGRHKGLWLAEIEMEDERERLPGCLPAWLGDEVTSDPRYTNAALAADH